MFGRVVWSVVWLLVVSVLVAGFVVGVGWLGWWLEGLCG